MRCGEVGRGDWGDVLLFSGQFLVIRLAKRWDAQLFCLTCIKTASFVSVWSAAQSLCITSTFKYFSPLVVLSLLAFDSPKMCESYSMARRLGWPRNLLQRAFTTAGLCKIVMATVCRGYGSVPSCSHAYACCSVRIGEVRLALRYWLHAGVYTY